MASSPGLLGDDPVVGIQSSVDWSKFVDALDVPTGQGTQWTPLDYERNNSFEIEDSPGAGPRVATSPRDKDTSPGYGVVIAPGIEHLVWETVWIYAVGSVKPHTNPYTGVPVTQDYGTRYFDFGFADVGSSTTAILVMRLSDAAHDLTANVSDSPNFTTDLAGSLPFTLNPTEEKQVSVIIVGDSEFIVQNAEMTFTVNPTTSLYLSMVAAVLILGGSANAHKGAMKLEYHFDTEKTRMSDGSTFRLGKLAKPYRTAKVTVAEGDEDDIELFYTTMIEAGRKGAILPLRCFMTNLTSPALATDTSVDVEDDTEFEVGGYAMLEDEANGSYDLRKLSSVAGNTLTFDGGLANNYSIALTKVFPAISGILDPKKFEVVNRRSIVEADADFTERVVTVEEVSAAPATITLSVRPEEAKMDAKLDKERKLLGKDSGIIEQVSWNTTQRTPMNHDMTYAFEGTGYRALLDAFKGCRGMEKPLRVPTWKGDLTAYSLAVSGAANINVTPASYSNMYTVYDQICIDWGYALQILGVSSVVNNGTYATLTLDANLVRDMPVGTKIHFVPLVHFSDESIELEFASHEICKSEVSFMEVIR